MLKLCAFSTKCLSLESQQTQGSSPGSSNKIVIIFSLLMWVLLSLARMGMFVGSYALMYILPHVGVLSQPLVASIMM